jgi:hypothetical protein
MHALKEKLMVFPSDSIDLEQQPCMDSGKSANKLIAIVSTLEHVILPKAEGGQTMSLA